MNITEIKVCSPGQLAFTTTEHFSFALTSQDRSNPYILRKAVGLEPGELIKIFSDGPKFFRTRPKERVVSFQVKLNPNYTGELTIGDLRDSLYKLIAFNTKANNWNADTKIQLKFMNGSIYVASLFGYITNMDTDIFSNSSDLTFTIECEDPFLRSTELIDLSSGIQTTSGARHGVLFSGNTYNVESAFHCVDNKSTAPHGFRMTVECISLPPSDETNPPLFIIWDNRSPIFYVFYAVAWSIHVGDKISFSSEEDNRYFLHSRYVEGIEVSVKFLLDKIYWGSIWPMISPGENFFEVSEGFRILNAYHRESYWGV